MLFLFTVFCAIYLIIFVPVLLLVSKRAKISEGTVVIGGGWANTYLSVQDRAGTGFVPGEYQPMGSHLSFHPRERTVWEENGGPGLYRICLVRNSYHLKVRETQVVGQNRRGQSSFPQSLH